MNIKPINKDLPYYLPKKSDPGSAGYDLSYSGLPVILHPNERLALGTNISLEIPDGYYGRIAPRSGLALKNGVDVLAGVVDSSYRGEIKVILINFGDRPVSFATESRIAQIIFERYYDFEMLEASQLLETIRGAGGFGSSGT